MVNYFIYATDDSGSTYKDEYFNTNALATVKAFHDEVKTLQSEDKEDPTDDKIVYLHWSDRCQQVEEDDVITRYLNQNGDGSDTLPHTILSWIGANVTKEDIIKLLYVITDGAVYDVRPCDPSMKIDYVKFYAFNSNVNCIDMSVASMFICDNKRYTIHCNEELVDETDLSTPYDYDQITIETFADKKEELKSYIKLQFLTKSPTDQRALDEITKLKILQTRLYEEQQASSDISDEIPESLINLNVKDKDSFIKQFKMTRFYKTLTNPDRHSKKQEIESCINTLINYINNDKKSFGFHDLKYSQKFTEITEEEEVENVIYANVKEIPFPDIIMSNETGVPVILLTHYNLMDKILFETMKPGQDNQKLKPNYRLARLYHRRPQRGRSRRPQLPTIAHFARFRNMIKCPLILMNDESFKKSIEYYYNLEAFKSMIEHGIKTGPRTRQEFTGAIVPLEEFDDYNDYILACTYFGGRQVPFNKGLLYYVIYKNCENLEYIEPNVVEYLKGYVERRISKTKCNLGLSDVSMADPKIRVKLTTALWYCVELSSIMFKNDEKHFTKEKMRMYCHYVKYMKEILGWFQYNIDTTSVNLRMNIFKNLNKLKRIPRPEERAMFILEQIFKKEDGFLVAEIVNPKKIYKLNYLQMDHKKVIDESVVSAKVDLNKFVHFMYHVEDTDVPVCKQTMRPYFVTDNNKSFYEQLMAKAQKVVIQKGKLTLEPVQKLNISRVLSVYKLYIQYVKEHSEFPVMEQYKNFVLKKKQFHNGKPVVFATNTIDTITKVCRRYNAVVRNRKKVTKFLETTKQSANREERIKKENPFDFDMNEISSYIKKAESNVELESDSKKNLKPSSTVPESST